MISTGFPTLTFHLPSLWIQTQKRCLQVSDTPRHGWRGRGAFLRTSSWLQVGSASPVHQSYYSFYGLFILGLLLQG